MVQVLLPVSDHIQHMQLGGVCQLSGQFAQAIISQREDVEAGAAAEFFGHAAEPVPVYIQVCQLLQLAQRARKWLWGEMKGDLNLVDSDCVHGLTLSEWSRGTCKWFSVRTSSVRFSHSPIESVSWVSRFWSTFRMDSCFKQPGKKTHRKTFRNLNNPSETETKLYSYLQGSIFLTFKHKLQDGWKRGWNSILDNGTGKVWKGTYFPKLAETLQKASWGSWPVCQGLRMYVLHCTLYKTYRTVKGVLF